MEEILASIRRIIADDDDAPKTANPEVAKMRAPAEAEDDVLDLAEVPDTKRPPERADLEIEMPDLSFHDAPETPGPVTARPVAPAEPEPMPTASPAAAVEPPAPPPKLIPEATPRSGLAAPAESLISNETTASVHHAFNILSHTILSQNARTLEDLVRDMLKPMLKVWLDDNLPPMVERLVRAEIERVARGSR